MPTEAKHASAVLALQRLDVARLVEHGNGEWLDLHLARLGERGFDDLIGLSEGQAWHVHFPEVGQDDRRNLAWIHAWPRFNAKPFRSLTDYRRIPLKPRVDGYRPGPYFPPAFGIPPGPAGAFC
jgi:hypothetical protein